MTEEFFRLSRSLRQTGSQFTLTSKAGGTLGMSSVDLARLRENLKRLWKEGEAFTLKEAMYLVLRGRRRS